VQHYRAAETELSGVGTWSLTATQECNDCKEKVKEDKECKVVKECKDNCDFEYKHHGWKFDVSPACLAHEETS
jgi:hypothetical protein